MSLIDDFQAWLSGQMNGSLNSPQQSPAMAYGANGKKNAFDFSFSNPFKSFIYLEDMFFFPVCKPYPGDMSKPAKQFYEQRI